MNIDVFNLTNEKLDKELSSLKEFLINVSKDEELGDVIFNVLYVEELCSFDIDL